MHSVEIKGGVLVSWVASIVTMVARGAAKKMIVKKLQTSLICSNHYNLERRSSNANKTIILYTNIFTFVIIEGDILD